MQKIRLYVQILLIYLESKGLKKMIKKQFVDYFILKNKYHI